MDQFNHSIQKAKIISNEFSTLTTKPKIDAKKMFGLMVRMNESMLEMMSGLKTAFELKMQAFTDQLNACTTFTCNELNYVKKEIDDVKKNDDTECINTLQSCSRDLKKVWIRFTYAQDAEDIRKANNYAAINEIFSQHNIKLNMTQFPIESFFFKTKKFSHDQLVPEIALCCTFVNSTLASIVKNGIKNFNKVLDESNKSHLIRYRVKADWSYNIRKLLKPCNEMKRFDVIERVLVTNDGIKVIHKEPDHQNQQIQTSTTFVNSIKKLDVLRQRLQDFNSTVSATETYNDEYFKLTFEDRKAVRNKYLENLHNEDDEYEVDDD